MGQQWYYYWQSKQKHCFVIEFWLCREANKTEAELLIEDTTDWFQKMVADYRWTKILIYYRAFLHDLAATDVEQHRKELTKHGQRKSQRAAILIMITYLLHHLPVGSYAVPLDWPSSSGLTCKTLQCYNMDSLGIVWRLKFSHNPFQFQQAQFFDIELIVVLDGVPLIPP